jgi:hypothetical protein
MRSGRKAVPAPLMAPSRYSSYKPGDKSTKNRGGTHVFWKDKHFLLH